MAILSVGIGPSKGRNRSAHEGPFRTARVGGIISERWAGSNRNGGRHHLGTVGEISPESASLADASLSYVTLSLAYQATVFPITQSIVAAKAAPWLNTLEWFALLFIGPAILGGLIGLNARQGWTRHLLAKLNINTSHPIDAAWDWKFTACDTCWVLAVLKDGTKWAGYLGAGSFLSTDPGERDLYIEQVYSIDDKDQWTPKGSSVWIASGELQSIEFWPTQGAGNV